MLGQGVDSMKPIIICLIQGIVNGKTKIVGARLLDIDSYKVMEATIESIVANVNNGIEVLGFNKIWSAPIPIQFPNSTDAENLRYDTVIEEMPHNMVRVANHVGKIYEKRFDDYTLWYEGVPKSKEFKVYDYSKVLAKKTKVFNKIYSVSDEGTVRLRDDFDRYKCKVEELVLPDGVISIAAGGFSNCRGIKRIVIPDSCERLGNTCFENMKDLEEIEVNGKMTKIPDRCFRGCNKLSKVTLSSYISEIGTEAFNGCYKLKKIKSNRAERIRKIGYMGLPMGCVIETGKFKI
jgi:hypothetical protein